MNIIEPKIIVDNYNGIQIMKNIEKACRTCYRSEDKITEDSYKRLISNCINRGHESVMEHEKISVTMICDIGVYKDLTRHRFGSFSIESTRYCNYGKDKFDNELKVINPVNLKDDKKLFSIWKNAIENIEENYMKLSTEGANADQLRLILPHSTAAKVRMTCNIREWRHILDLRTKIMTHPSIRQILIPLLLKFKDTMPELFNDIEYDETFKPDDYAELIIEE